MSFLLTALLWVTAVSAQNLELTVWQAHPAEPPFVLAVKKGQSPMDAAKAYVSAVQSHKELRLLFKDFDFSELSFKTFRPLSTQDMQTRALLIANRANDLKAGDWRVESFARLFRSTGTNSYMVLPAADVALSSAEKTEFVHLLDESFPAFMAMGGDDIDQTLWNGKNYAHSVVNRARDRFEKRLIEQKIRSIKHRKKNSVRKDRLAGVCRGAQFIARSLGYEIGTHIPDDFQDSSVHHGGAWVPETHISEPSHKVSLLTTQNSFLKQLVGGVSEVEVNTYHHQYIKWKAGGSLELAAVGEDGVPEAFESSDGSIVLFQFHPELMAVRSQGLLREMGENIMHGLMQFLMPYQKGVCAGLLNPT